MILRQFSALWPKALYIILLSLLAGILTGCSAFRHDSDVKNLFTPYDKALVFSLGSFEDYTWDPDSNIVELVYMQDDTLQAHMVYLQQDSFYFAQRTIPRNDGDDDEAYNGFHRGTLGGGDGDENMSLDLYDSGTIAIFHACNTLKDKPAYRPVDGLTLDSSREVVLLYQDTLKCLAGIPGEDTMPDILCFYQYRAHHWTLCQTIDLNSLIGQSAVFKYITGAKFRFAAYPVIGITYESGNEENVIILAPGRSRNKHAAIRRYGL